jgi:hypothetical protein
MRLIITRSYEEPSRKDRYPSPYRFEARLELSDEERMIIERYQLGDYVLTRSQVSRTTLADLMRGHREAQSDLDLLIGNEQALRGACEGLPTLFQYCSSFGQGMVFEYPS